MSDALRTPRIGPRLLRAIAAVFTLSLVAYILIPVLVTLAMSFSGAAQLRFPIRSWSLGWYAEFAASPQWTGALINSLIIATGTAVMSTIAGVAAAYAYTRYTLRFSTLLYVLLMLPLFMPGIVLGLGVALTFSRFSIGGYSLFGSHLLVMIAHSLWAMPLVFLLMEAVFRMTDRRVIEAAQDLGCPPLRTFFEIEVPMISTGLISSLLFAFVISLNEFVMALFLTDRDTQTLPVLMWLGLRSAATPQIAVASVVLSLSVFACLSLIMVWYVRQLRKTTR
jgi:putative spermidine/putrescine transport system permease protein/spermidine/putrescine transport system permease protein